ncbi:multicopper oxidase domain-containing protein [Paenibacillus humicola]|uniref:multicopper oxidase domain-containing protein n=1 Tax=Paenibacillus humicola TaxID=3110540 RepID=UPI00237B4697|nr:multicopper oxidase domain-containing protein [Paenibacillus humicola]
MLRIWKITSILAAAACLLLGTSAYADSDEASMGMGVSPVMQLAVNGKLIAGIQPVWDASMADEIVPLRPVAAAMGMTVGWDRKDGAVVIDTFGAPVITDRSVKLPVLIGGKQAPADINAAVVNGIAMAAAKPLAKALDADTAMNGNTLQFTSHAALKEFDAENRAVDDVFNGVGLTPHIAADGTKEFTLTAGLHAWEPEKGVEAAAWTFNGQAPGPTIRVKQGDHVRITLVNNLPEPTTVHWHGQTVPNAMDGVPDITQPPVESGQSFVYDFTVRSSPGTYMYHSHYDDMMQVGSGLYGAFIIDPKDGAGAPEYDHDYTYLLSGFSINSPIGSEEDDYTMDGRSYPYTPDIVVKQGETVRIRLINIDTMEIHAMHLHGMNFRVIAKDGQPSDDKQEMNTLLIGPGETYDIAFTADQIGTWMFHCHMLDHTMHPDGTMAGLVSLVKVLPD